MIQIKSFTPKCSTTLTPFSCSKSQLSVTGIILQFWKTPKWLMATSKKHIFSKFSRHFDNNVSVRFPTSFSDCSSGKQKESSLVYLTTCLLNFKECSMSHFLSTRHTVLQQKLPQLHNTKSNISFDVTSLSRLLSNSFLLPLILVCPPQGT